MELAALDVPPVDAKELLGAEFLRDSVEGLPEVSEIDEARSLFVRRVKGKSDANSADNEEGN